MKDEELKALVQKPRDIQIGDRVNPRPRHLCENANTSPNYNNGDMELARPEGHIVEDISDRYHKYQVARLSNGYLYRLDWLELV